MTLQYTTYPIASRGLATSFTEAELPNDFALQFKNRFINAAGGAEKRQGMVRYGAIVPGSPEITGIHELMRIDGTTILMVSARGRIYKYIDESTWTTVYFDGDIDGVYRSVQMNKKLIFNNGINRNIYTEDGITFKELFPVIERGKATSNTTHTGLHDSGVTNWAANSLVHINDLVYDQTQNGYGVVTVVSTASITHSPISSSATGIGVATSNSTVGDVYEITDLVELNVIPTGVEDDNVAIAGEDSFNTIVVSAVPDWTKTEILPGDYIRNTTKNWITQVTAVSTTELGILNALVSAGDSLVFLKSAMPISKRTHVHFSRAYMIDNRDLRRIVISGANNPEDLTTDSGTLESSTISFGSYQPSADKVVGFASFQRFLAIGGLRNVYLFEGTTPIQDVSTQSVDFNIVGMFPQGVVCPDGLLSIGNDLAYVSVDGIQSVAMQGNASMLGAENLSEPLRTTLRDKIASVDPSTIFMFQYPRRSWLCVKISSELYVYNYTAFFGAAQQANNQFPATRGSWSIFDGLFAQQRVYTVLSDGSLLCAGAGGKVYKFDQDTYDDDGIPYQTVYQTGWLSMNPQRRTPTIKAGKYIRPVLDAGSDITYTVSVEAPFNVESNDTITINVSNESGVVGSGTIGIASIGGTSIVDNKYALRWRGKEARFTFSTYDSQGPDVLSRFTVYFATAGAR